MYSGDEIVALIIAGMIALHSWGQFLMQVTLIRPYRYQPAARFPLYVAVGLSGVALFYILNQWSSHDVRDSGQYTFFYLVLGAGWLGLGRYVMNYLNLCLRDDLLERNNAASGWACGGALLGIMLCFAGGNVGDGPGWWVVIYCAVLATGTAAVAWIILDVLTGASDTISIDRDVAAGIRIGGFWIAGGLILGRAVAGNWISFDAANKDFLVLGWPFLLLLAIATLVELPFRPGGSYEKTSLFIKGVLPAAIYVFGASLVVVGLGKP
jgi:uncharacterized membrane protein YjfL (UPF0719 family)